MLRFDVGTWNPFQNRSLLVTKQIWQQSKYILKAIHSKADCLVQYYAKVENEDI